MKLLARITGIAVILGLSACTGMNQVNPESPLQPKYSAEARELGQLKVDTITKAPIQYFGAVQLNTTPEEAYRYVGDLESISEWLPIAEKVTKLDHSNSQTPGQSGQGTLRYVEAALGDGVVETITYWEDGVGYGYSIPDSAGLPMTGHLAVLQVESDGSGGALVTYRQYFTPADSLPGKLSSHIGRIVLNMALDNLVEKFDGEVL